MNSGSGFSPTSSGFAETTSALDVLVLYEDVVTGRRGKQLMDQVTEHVNLVVNFRLNLVRFDLLDVPALRQLVLGNLLNCDILILAAHGHNQLPASVLSWLDHWLTAQADRDRALVMSLDQRTRDSNHAGQLHYDLQAAGCKAGVEVFAQYGDVPESEFDTAIANIRYRAETPSVLLDQAIHHANTRSFRHWGIDD